MQVYDDIQTELQEKTAVLKRMKQRVRGLNTEITDLQSEFERDRQVSGDWSQYSAPIGPQQSIMARGAVIGQLVTILSSDWSTA